MAVECFSTAVVRLRGVSRLRIQCLDHRTESASEQVEAVHHRILQVVAERQVLCTSSGTESLKRFLNEEVASIASTMIK